MKRNPAFLADPPAKPRRKRGGEKRHLAFVASLPCACCHMMDSTEVHHLLRVPLELGGKHGMAEKNADQWTIPLCAFHHNASVGGRYSVHGFGNEVEFLAKYGIDGPAMAAALHSVSGDREAGIRIVVGRG